MKALAPALFLLAGACSPAPKGDAESEQVISERAADIRNQADSDVAKQIEEIDAAANAEAAELASDPINTQ